MALPIAAMTSAEILTVRDGQIVRAISRADVAWHILALAEEPPPGRQRTPVITRGTGRMPGTAASDASSVVPHVPRIS